MKYQYQVDKIPITNIKYESIQSQENSRIQQRYLHNNNYTNIKDIDTDDINNSNNSINININHNNHNNNKNKIKSSPTSQFKNNIYPQQLPCPSILDHLKLTTLYNKPSYEQMFSLQQQKKYLYELLVLKQQDIQKLHMNIKQFQQINLQMEKKYESVLVQRQEYIRRLQEQNYGLKQKMNKFNMIKSNLMDEFKILKTQYERQQQQIQSYKHIQDSINTLAQQNTKLKHQLNQLTDHNVQIHNKNTKLSTQNKQIQRKLSDLMRQLMSIKIYTVNMFTPNEWHYQKEKNKQNQQYKQNKQNKQNQQNKQNKQNKSLLDSANIEYINYIKKDRAIQKLSQNNKNYGNKNKTQRANSVNYSNNVNTYNNRNKQNSLYSIHKIKRSY